jgi:ribonuclease E
VRALEGVMQYRPEAVRRSERIEGDERDAVEDGADTDLAGAAEPEAGSPSQSGQPGEGAKRRRRRRRGRRGSAGPGPGGTPQQNANEADSGGTSLDLARDQIEAADDSGDDVDAPPEGDADDVTTPSDPSTTTPDEEAEPEQRPASSPPDDDHQR